MAQNLLLIQKEYLQKVWLRPLFPLPRVALYYTFHLPDDEFPASATCLFAANASTFMPLAGLADTAEFTARRIIELVSKG
jgi:hypothetical protein